MTGTADQSQILSPKTKLGYGFGGMGIDFVWQSSSLFLLYYYTDVLGIPASVAGIVFMVSLIWDGITDPVMGGVTTRTAQRMGGYKGWIKVGIIPLGICYVLLFSGPYIGHAIGMLAYAILSSLLFRTAFTVVAIPYYSLPARLSLDSRERTRSIVYRLVMAAMATTFLSIMTLNLVGFIGGDDKAFGFQVVAIAYALASVIALFVCTRMIDEKVQDQLEKPPGVKMLWQVLAANRPAQIAMLASVFVNMSFTFGGQMSIYYFEYYLQRPDLTGFALGGVVATNLVMTPVWGAMSRKYSNKAIWFAGTAIALVPFMFLLPYTGKDPYVTIGLIMLTYVGMPALPVASVSMMQDVVEVSAFRTGVRGEGVLSGIGGLVFKVAVGVSAAMVGVSLDLIGYVANEVQTEETSRAMHYVLCAGGAIGTSLAFVVICFFRVDRQLHTRLLRAIEYREQRALRALNANPQPSGDATA